MSEIAEFSAEPQTEAITQGPNLANTAPVLAIVAMQAVETAPVEVVEDVKPENMFKPPSRTQEQLASPRTLPNDPVTIYLRQIGEFGLLTKEGEVWLAKQVEKGKEAAKQLSLEQELTPLEARAAKRAIREGEEAKKELIQSNTRLVVSIAKKYLWSGVELEDLIQEGNFGLIRAVDKFKWKKGFKLSTYATYWIRQFIARGIQGINSTIRVPTNIQDKIMALQKMETALINGDLPPTSEELAEKLEWNLEEVEDVLHFRELLSSVSYNTPVGEDGDAELQDFIADPKSETAFSSVDNKTDLAIAMQEHGAGLTERERQVVDRRFGLSLGYRMTLKEIAKEFSVTTEAVRQTQFRAIRKLRSAAEALPEVY